MTQLFSTDLVHKTELVTSTNQSIESPALTDQAYESPAPIDGKYESLTQSDRTYESLSPIDLTSEPLTLSDLTSEPSTPIDLTSESSTPSGQTYESQTPSVGISTPLNRQGTIDLERLNEALRHMLSHNSLLLERKVMETEDEMKKSKKSTKRQNEDPQMSKEISANNNGVELMTRLTQNLSTEISEVNNNMLETYKNISTKLNLLLIEEKKSRNLEIVARESEMRKEREERTRERSKERETILWMLNTMVILVFVILYFILKYKEQEEKKSKGFSFTLFNFK